MSAYMFETIDDRGCVRYRGTYTSDDGFTFIKMPYFTMIYTDYDGSSYSNAKNRNVTSVTKYGIANMLSSGIKVDLIVKGKTSTDLILPLVGIDSDYAYFKDDSGLVLKVDGNGVVTEEGK